jgi:bifunctional DNA-binding transcriptional regulator/antitoxin component of YhaV-PrlF toxin-antitoxin module
MDVSFSLDIYLIMGLLLVVEEREIQQGRRVAIPKEIRDEFGLVEGTVVKTRSRIGLIEIEPPVKLSKLVGLVKTDKGNAMRGGK